LNRDNVFTNLDWPTVLIWLLLMMAGWLNIFAAVYDVQLHPSIFDLSINSGKQLMWIGTSLILATLVLAIDYQFYDNAAYLIYLSICGLLVVVLLVGKTVAGSKSWLGIGGFGIQPSEFAKTAVALALARYLSDSSIRLDNFKELAAAGMVIGLPALLILAQNDTGSTLVFASFVIVLYREGLTPALPLLGIYIVALFILTLIVPQLWLLIGTGIIALALWFVSGRTIRNTGLVIAGLMLTVGIISGVDFFVNSVLQPHQQDRIRALINPEADPLGAGWNVTQSKIAIGSGGLLGKGFLEGTQTKFDFVPEQSTDFIFCTIGEEHGWLGALVVIGMFVFLLMRILDIAERQKTRFGRVYGYGVAGILFFHMMVNIGMTIGLFPVIGIPLPFFSYGGSSLWSFTVLLFVLLRIDSARSMLLFRN
jgi:rod shape determining protein RodA